MKLADIYEYGTNLKKCKYHIFKIHKKKQKKSNHLQFIAKLIFYKRWLCLIFYLVESVYISVLVKYCRGRNYSPILLKLRCTGIF